MPVAIAVVIPARNEARRIGATVRAARRIDGVDLVVVADDGSTDRTRDLATHEGAVVVSHYRPQGKAAAMVLGASAVATVDAREAASHGTCCSSTPTSATPRPGPPRWSSRSAPVPPT